MHHMRYGFDSVTRSEAHSPHNKSRSLLSRSRVQGPGSRRAFRTRHKSARCGPAAFGHARTHMCICPSGAHMHAYVHVGLFGTRVYRPREYRPRLRPRPSLAHHAPWHHRVESSRVESSRLAATPFSMHLQSSRVESSPVESSRVESSPSPVQCGTRWQGSVCRTR